MFETVRKVYYGMWKNSKQNQKKKKKSHIANECIYTFCIRVMLLIGFLWNTSVYTSARRKNTMEIKICHIPCSWSKHITGGSPQYWVSAVAVMTTNQPSSICRWLTRNAKPFVHSLRLLTKYAWYFLWVAQRTLGENYTICAYRKTTLENDFWCRKSSHMS